MEHQKTVQLPEDNESRHNFGLTTALGVAIGIALVLTSVSTALYLASNFSRIDLSKPKNADVRSQVNESTKDSKIDSTGPITGASIKEMMSHMQATQKKLQAAGNFSSPILEDTTLGIGTGAE